MAGAGGARRRSLSNLTPAPGLACTTKRSRSSANCSAPCCCRFTGEFYDVDIPLIGPVIGPVGAADIGSVVPTPPPLVASLGGPWTIRHIAPLVDRVELKFGRSTRGGDLDVVGVLAECTRDDLPAPRGRGRGARAVNPTVPIGTFTMIAVGPDADVRGIRERYGDGLYAAFAGSPAQVREAIASLGELGIDRVQVTESLPGSILRLLDT